MNYKGAILRMLKDYGAYSGYIENFKKLERYGATYRNSKNKVLIRKSFDVFFETFINVRGGANKDRTRDIFYYFINDSFAWDMTKEKSSYWSGILSKMNRIGRIITNHQDTVASREELEYCETIKEILNNDGKKDIQRL